MAHCLAVSAFKSNRAGGLYNEDLYAGKVGKETKTYKITPYPREGNSLGSKGRHAHRVMILPFSNVYNLILYS